MTIAHIFVLALGAAVYPTLVAVVLVVLQRPRPTRILLAFLAGGLAISLTIGLVLVFTLESTNAVSEGRSAWANLALGALSLLVAALLFRPARHAKRVPDAQAKTPWTERTLGHDSLKLAFVAGVVLDLPSVFYLVALKDIAQADYGVASSVLLVLGFNLIMFVLIEAPLVALVLAPEWAAGAVQRGNAWLRANGRRTGAWVALVLGAYLVVRGVLGLT